MWLIVRSLMEIIILLRTGYLQVQTMGAHFIYSLPVSPKSLGIREIYEIALRKRLRYQTPVVIVAGTEKHRNRFKKKSGRSSGKESRVDLTPFPLIELDEGSADERLGRLQKALSKALNMPSGACVPIDDDGVIDSSPYNKVF